MAVVENKPVIALRDGQRLDQPTFHARYLHTPEHFRAELIGGTVFVASPVLHEHMLRANLINYWLASYAVDTPPVIALDDGTVILGKDSEPEPDAMLLLRTEFGGRTRVVDGYVTGAPELVVEVANSSETVDLNQKKDDYERAGVNEYLVVLLRSREVRWFVLDGGAYRLLEPGTDGMLRSERFPGLWLDPEALLREDRQQLRAVGRAGIESAEHQAWLASFAQAGAG